MSTDESVTLFHILPSLCSQKVRLVLAEKGVPYSERIVDIGPRMQNYEPWYVRMNPKAVVPTLLHGERVVSDSARIVRYVAERFDGPELLPEDPERRALVDDLVDGIDAIAFRTISYGGEHAPKRLLHFAVGRRLRRLEAHLQGNPDLAEAYRAKIEDVRGWQHGIVDPDEIERARETARAAMAHADALLADGRPYLTGPTYTLADALYTVAVARMHMIGMRTDLSALPRLEDWYRRMKSRPSFARARLLERFDPVVMLRVFGPFLLPRLAVAAGGLVAVGGLVAYAWM